MSWLHLSILFKVDSLVTMITDKTQISRLRWEIENNKTKKGKKRLTAAQLLYKKEQVRLYEKSLKNVEDKVESINTTVTNTNTRLQNLDENFEQRMCKAFNAVLTGEWQPECTKNSTASGRVAMRRVQIRHMNNMTNIDRSKTALDVFVQKMGALDPSKAEQWSEKVEGWFQEKLIELGVEEAEEAALSSEEPATASSSSKQTADSACAPPQDPEVQELLKAQAKEQESLESEISSAKTAETEAYKALYSASAEEAKAEAKEKVQEAESNHNRLVMHKMKLPHLHQVQLQELSARSAPPPTPPKKRPVAEAPATTPAKKARKTAAEAPEPPAKQALKCPCCNFVAKSERGLKTHQTRQQHFEKPDEEEEAEEEEEEEEEEESEQENEDKDLEHVVLSKEAEEALNASSEAINQSTMALQEVKGEWLFAKDTAGKSVALAKFAAAKNELEQAHLNRLKLKQQIVEDDLNERRKEALAAAVERKAARAAAEAKRRAEAEEKAKVEQAKLEEKARRQELANELKPKRAELSKAYSLAKKNTDAALEAKNSSEAYRLLNAATNKKDYSDANTLYKPLLQAYEESVKEEKRLLRELDDVRLKMAELLK